MASKYSCGLVQDLLPLYRDNVCGDESRAAVEEHLQECAECSHILEQLNGDKIEQALSLEAGAVLKNHQKKEKRISAIYGLITAGILLIPVIVCLICNLAIGHALDWFFIVLTSLLVVASVTVVPMLATEMRFLKAAGCCTLSTLLLLFTCCVYTRGDWFLAAAVPVIFGLSLLLMPAVVWQIPLPEPLKNHKTLCVILWDVAWLLIMLAVLCVYVGGDWFWTAAVPVIFGLSVLLMPVVIRQIPLPNPLLNHKALLVMIWDTLWLYGIMFSSAKYSNSEYYWHNSLLITSWCLLLPWAVFVIIRYLRLHPLVKTGLVILVTGVFSATINDAIRLILLPYGATNAPSILEANLFQWTGYPQTDANARVLILIGSVVIGVMLFFFGLNAGRKKK